jgi:hypothetical protein
VLRGARHFLWYLLMERQEENVRRRGSHPQHFMFVARVLQRHPNYKWVAVISIWISLNGKQPDDCLQLQMALSGTIEV